MRRTTTLALVAVLLATGCSSVETTVPPLSPTAAEVITRIDDAFGEQAPLNPGEVIVPEGCRLAIEIDEYGFEVEIVVCDEDPATTDPGTVPATGETPELTGWAGGEDARSVARRLRGAVGLQSGCEGAQDLIALEGLAAVVPLEVRNNLLAAIADLRRSAVACNSDSVAWQAALQSALDHLEEMAAVLEAAHE